SGSGPCSPRIELAQLMKTPQAWVRSVGRLDARGLCLSQNTRRTAATARCLLETCRSAIGPDPASLWRSNSITGRWAVILHDEASHYGASASVAVAVKIFGNLIAVGPVDALQPFGLAN